MNSLAKNVKYAPANITGINSRNNKEVSTYIFTYLQNKKKDSIGTYKNYKRYFSEFFMYTCNKELNKLTWDDIFNIRFDQAQDFHSNEKDKNIDTAQQKMFVIKKLWKNLFLTNKSINPNRKLDLDIMEFEKISKEKLNKTHYATLNSKEMDLLFEHALTYKRKPLTRKMFFEFLYIVGCRESVAKGRNGKGVKWTDIRRKEDSNAGIKVWVVGLEDKGFKDKGKTVEKSISDSFYNKLLQLKEESSSEYVFDLNINTFLDTFNDFREKYNLKTKDGRKVCIHSIKRASGILTQETFNDINITRLQLQHSSSDMTMTYIEDAQYTKQASYMLGKDIDLNAFDDLSKEELLDLIKNGGRSVQIKFLDEMESRVN